MGKILPILIALIGLGGGVGAGLLLRPGPAAHDGEQVCFSPAELAAIKEEAGIAPDDPDGGASASEFVKLNNQFVVPVVKDGLVRSLVVMSISVEVTPGGREELYQREPKLRDAFLQVMFDHSNTGGFQGAFTAAANMDPLRIALRETARKVLGQIALDVLITEIVRQDVQS